MPYRANLNSLDNRRLSRPIFANLNMFLAVVVIIVLLLSFFQFRGGLSGLFGLILMIIGTCLECWVCCISFKLPRFGRPRHILLYMIIIFVGMIVFISALTLEKMWRAVFIVSMVIQLLYVSCCLYTYYFLRHLPPLPGSNNGDGQRSGGISGAYSPGQQHDGTSHNNNANNGENVIEPDIFVPPDMFSNYDNVIEGDGYNITEMEDSAGGVSEKPSTLKDKSQESDNMPIDYFNNIYAVPSDGGGLQYPPCDGANYNYMMNPNSNAPTGVPSAHVNPYANRYTDNADSQTIV